MNPTREDRCKVPQPLLHAIDRLGSSRSTVLNRAGLPVSFPLGNGAYITTLQLFKLWTVVDSLNTDPNLGINLVTATDSTDHHPAFLAACYASDYRDALLRVARFKRLERSVETHFTEDEREFQVSREWYFADEPEPALSVEVSFAFLLELGRKGTGQRVTPKRVEFISHTPRGDGLHAYFGCPIHYGAPCNVIAFDTADINRAFIAHNSEFLKILAPALESALVEHSPRSELEDKIKAALTKRMAGGHPHIGQIASDLGMSTRTLQRRIAEEGLTFTSLLFNARRALAQQLLKHPLVDSEEIACLLGYADRSSFYRAFKDWEGMTPNQWREKN